MRLACLMLLLLIPACAVRPTAEPVAMRIEAAEPARQRPAAALVFDPPTTFADPPFDLVRDPRRQGAYWGVQGPVTTFYYQRSDDRYGYGWDWDRLGESYRRRTVETRIGSSVR